MELSKLVEARDLFKKHFYNSEITSNVFCGRRPPQDFVDFGLLFYNMLINKELINECLNWSHCEETLRSIGIDISQESFYAFYDLDEAEGEFGEEEFQNLKPDDVEELIKFFAQDINGLAKMGDWL